MEFLFYLMRRKIKMDMENSGAETKCDACDFEVIYACMGVQNVYVCRSCYNKTRVGELSIEKIVEIRQGKSPKIEG